MTAGEPVGVPTPELGSYVKKGEALKASKREAAPKMTLPLFVRKQIRSQVEHLVDRRGMHPW